VTESFRKAILILMKLLDQLKFWYI